MGGFNRLIAFWVKLGERGSRWCRRVIIGVVGEKVFSGVTDSPQC